MSLGLHKFAARKQLKLGQDITSFRLKATNLALCFNRKSKESQLRITNNINQ